MIRIFAAPTRYIQGPGALARVGPVVAALGHRPLLVADTLVAGLVGPEIVRGFAAPAPALLNFNGEVTDANIAALLGQPAAASADVVVGIGGGKALDAGKAAALKLGVPYVSVPTIASNDGPASRGIAMYDDSHRLVRVDQLPANPACVIVDTAVIARAPVRFLRAGIGDAIAKKFEAEGCRAGGGLTKHGTPPMHTALVLADAAYRLLRQHAAGALRACERGEPDDDLEATVEAAVLLSAMGFENGGLSIAHSVTRGLQAVRGARDRLHGEHVAYGTLVHRHVDGAGEQALEDLIGFFRETGLPTSLADLGLAAPTTAEKATIATLTMQSPHIRNLGRSVTQESLLAAIDWLESRPA